MTSHTGTANVLYDLGFEDAADLTAKVQLAVKINDLIDRRGLTQVETSALTGMSQPKVSQIRRYKLLNISLERLMLALVSWTSAWRSGSAARAAPTLPESASSPTARAPPLYRHAPLRCTGPNPAGIRYHSPMRNSSSITSPSPPLT